MSDELTFQPDDDAAPQDEPWTLLIADDEEEVHSVTKLALSDFRFAGRPLEYLHAYSGAEACKMIETTPRIALVLLDVVMESDRAGLDVVEYVRNKLGNNFVRIILRTGQPGQAPELEVITRYDINDYKYKTELTRERLFTTVFTSLSTYRDLKALDINRRGLKKVIDASARIFELRSLEYLAQGVLEQLTGLLFLDPDAVILGVAGLAADRHHDGKMIVIAGTGAYQPLVGKDASNTLPPQVLARIREAAARDAPRYGKDYFVRRDAADEEELIFYLGSKRPLAKPDSEMIETFCTNVSIAHRNLAKLEAARGRRKKDRE